MRIIFIGSLKNKPYGGMDIIINYYQFFKSQNFETIFLNLKRDSFFKRLLFKNTSHRYYNEKINFLNSLKDIKDKDFVIIPEIHVGKYADIFSKRNISFAILVQSYFIANSESIEKYVNSKFLISTSQYITHCLKKIFPNKEILSLRLAPKSLHCSLQKQKTICYMPRKLNKHSQLVILLLKKSIPGNWRIKIIDNLSHDKVLEEFNKSSIFLSFTDFDGFGLPPLEAAIHGNIVIGYSGIGGKEYFKKPIFHEIEFGNKLMLINKVKYMIDKIDNGYLDSRNIHKQREKLNKYYSEKNQKLRLNQLINKIKIYA